MMSRFLSYTTRVFVVSTALVAVFVTQAAAQAVKFEVKAPLTAAEGEQFRIEFVVTATDTDLSQSQFTPPDFSGNVSVLSGPIKSDWVNSSFDGRTATTQAGATYTYWVQATRVGKIQVAAARLVVGGKSYTTRPTVVEVAAAGPSGAPGTGGAVGADARSARAQPQQTELQSDDVLLRLQVNRRESFKGEPLVATLKLYSRVPLSGLNVSKAPTMNGFWAQDLDVSAHQPSRESYGGKPYQTHVLRQWLLYPQRTGSLELEQLEMTGTAHIELGQAESSGNPLWDMAFGGQNRYLEVPLKIHSPAVKIQVKELPRPMPEGFAGAVGKFELDGLISGDRFPANTAGSITLRLSGTGDFPLIELPKIEFPAGFEPYSSKSTDRLTQTTRGTSGERIYEYPFIARAQGRFTIPGVVLTYFDPAQGSYHTLRTGDFHVEVLRDEGAGGDSDGLGMVSGVTKEDLQLLGQDIRFIRIGTPGLRRIGQGQFLWSGGWFLSVGAIWLVFGAVLYLLQRRIRQRADLTRVKTKKANKMAGRRLKAAKGHMQAGQEGDFFEEMLKALWGYMGDKLLIDVANLTKENVRHQLELRGVEEEQVDEFLSLISACEFARYSPAVGVPMGQAYAAALELIERSESKL